MMRRVHNAKVSSWFLQIRPESEQLRLAKLLWKMTSHFEKTEEGKLFELIRATFRFPRWGETTQRDITVMRALFVKRSGLPAHDEQTLQHASFVFLPETVTSFVR